MFLPCLQAVLVASRKSLTQRKGVLDITHEILERLEAHLRAAGQLTVCRSFACVMVAVFLYCHCLTLFISGYCKHEGNQCRGGGGTNTEPNIIGRIAGESLSLCVSGLRISQWTNIACWIKKFKKLGRVSGCPLELNGPMYFRCILNCMKLGH